MRAGLSVLDSENLRVASMLIAHAAFLRNGCHLSRRGGAGKDLGSKFVLNPGHARHETSKKVLEKNIAAQVSMTFQKEVPEKQQAKDMEAS